MAKKVNKDYSSFIFKIFDDQRLLRNYSRIEPRSIIGEYGILINKISSKKKKWIYKIYQFTNAFNKNHISEFYDNIYFKKCYTKKYNFINNNNFLFDKAKEMIETIVNSFLHININLKQRIPISNFNISSNKNILNEENIKILEKENFRYNKFNKI